MFPREKFLSRGISVLSDLELVQILVGSGIKGKDFKKISTSLMSRIRASIKQEKPLELKSLTEVEGVGEVVAMRILCGVELGRRIYGIHESNVVRITDSESAYSLFKDMGDLKRERVDILCLNSRFEYINRESIAMGSLNCANLSPREVIYTAITHNSAFIILAHNHPSGSSMPSQEDITLTKSINDALQLVGIQLLDHIVVGKDSWKSIPLD